MTALDPSRTVGRSGFGRRETRRHPYRTLPSCAVISPNESGGAIEGRTVVWALALALVSPPVALAVQRGALTVVTESCFKGRTSRPIRTDVAVFSDTQSAEVLKTQAQIHAANRDLDKNALEVQRTGGEQDNKLVDRMLAGYDKLFDQVKHSRAIARALNMPGWKKTFELQPQQVLVVGMSVSEGQPTADFRLKRVRIEPGKTTTVLFDYSDTTMGNSGCPTRPELALPVG
jgi:hypothetical protein